MKKKEVNMSGKKAVAAEICQAEAGNFAVKENLFSKEQLLKSEKFFGKKDILNALLADGELYSVLAAEKKIEKFMKGKVR